MLSALMAGLIASAPVPVSVEKTPAGYRLLRAGKPYTIKGVGGTSRMTEFVAAGGNSMRTWGTDQQNLDDAQKHGLTVMLGIWLGHKKDVDYTDAAKVKAQYEMVRGEVLKYKDHPALLLWGLGNEMENDNDIPELWMALEELFKLVKKLDPHHPTSTVVADISPQKIKHLLTYCPSLDILSINSYGGLASIPERLKAAGWTKPYIVTEFGPNGPWEVGRTAWGAAFEPSSTDKAKKYASDYKHSIAGQPGWCLGSYAFLWGWKQEETPTWFGMFLPTGERTQAVEVMTEAWGGKVKNFAPRVTASSMEANGREVAAGSAQVASISASDPESDKLSYRWEVRYEASEKRYAGEGEKLPLLVGDTKVTSDGRFAFTAPREAAAYRLYVTVLDGQGGAATVNWPFKVIK